MKTVPIDDLILFLQNTKDQVVKQKVKGTPYIGEDQMKEFYDGYGDDVSDDGTISVNSQRESDIAALKTSGAKKTSPKAKTSSKKTVSKK